MANAGSMIGTKPFRGLLVGYPKGGKTGAIIPLIEAGFKVRMLAFETNYDVLLNYTDEKALANLDIVTLEDRFELLDGKRTLTVSGIPKAFTEGLKMMQRWKYVENGQTVDLGASAEWGQDTIVVVDSMSAEAEASLNWSIKMANKDPSSMTSAIWGMARKNLTDAIKARASKRNNFHLIYLGHLHMLGPQDFINQSDEKEENKPIKEKKLDAIVEDLIPTKLFPVAVTKAQSQNIAKEFPTMILAEKVTVAGKEKRILRTVAGAELDLGVPHPDVKATYPQETGLLDIFKAFGIKPPNA